MHSVAILLKLKLQSVFMSFTYNLLNPGIQSTFPPSSIGDVMVQLHFKSASGSFRLFLPSTHIQTGSPLVPSIHPASPQLTSKSIHGCVGTSANVNRFYKQKCLGPTQNKYNNKNQAKIRIKKSLHWSVEF